MTDCLISPEELQAELKALRGEAMGWQPLDHRAYVHQGNTDDPNGVICIVGIADIELAGSNVLLLT